MAANIDTMLYVGETPWHGLGTRYDVPPATPAEIITGAQMDWEVGHKKMQTDLHDHVLNYHAIYRLDNNNVLGVVNKDESRINHVQNVDTFNAFSDLLGNEVTIETAASLDKGGTVFGCFKINDGYKILDDDIDHYLVVVNNHLRCNGTVTIINTPIRVVCQNTLDVALNNNCRKINIPITRDSYINKELAQKIIGSATYAIDDLKNNAEIFVQNKIDRAYIDRLLDELFPFIEVKDQMSPHNKANDKIDMMRNTFVQNCLNADNLSNYRGTEYQILMGVTDFAQHYYTNPDKSYDLKYRMGTILGGTDSTQPIALTQKFLKVRKRLASVA